MALSALDASEGGAAPLSAMARTVVRARLAELSPRDRAVVEALAVIGEGAPPTSSRPWPASRSASSAPRATRWSPPGCCAPTARASPTA